MATIEFLQKRKFKIELVDKSLNSVRMSTIGGKNITLTSYHKIKRQKVEKKNFYKPKCAKKISYNTVQFNSCNSKTCSSKICNPITSNCLKFKIIKTDSEEDM